MSRRQLARTRANFPRMKDRAYSRREGPVVSWGGGMNCTCGAVIRWGTMRRAEYDRLLEDLAAHDYCDDDPFIDEIGGEWICEHTRPDLFGDPEGIELVAKIHARKRAAQ